MKKLIKLITVTLIMVDAPPVRALMKKSLDQSSSVYSILEIYVKQKTTVIQDEQTGKNLENTIHYEPIIIFYFIKNLLIRKLQKKLH
jgi:hypothetical protein